MNYSFKVYIDNGREHFRWQSDTDFVATSGTAKKDFKLSQSLLDLLYLDVDPLYNLTKHMGDEIRKLYDKDGEKNIAFLRDSFDRLAETHLYFEFLRLDWSDRLDKYVKGEMSNPAKAMHYKEITHIPSNITTWQNQIKNIFTKVLDVLSPDKPIQAKMSELYENRDFEGLLLFDFQPLSTTFERSDSNTFTEVLNPRNIGDIVDYFLRNIISRDMTFKVCKSCGKYFPASASHGNSEYCNRIFYGLAADGSKTLDTGKTCKEIGSVKVYQAKVAENPEYAAYSRAYKTHFARIKAKKLTKEYFQIWAEEARKLRDEVTAGALSLEEYKNWLKR